MIRPRLLPRRFRLVAATVVISGLSSVFVVYADDRSNDRATNRTGEPAHWSFRRLLRPQVPAVLAADRVRSPIDAFVLAKLEENDLGIAPEADRLVLMRRAYLDLIGLPPSPQEIEAYLADTASDSYQQLIDRLLDSPHYGERWGRHWLDVAGYSDSRGILVGEVPRPTHYLYRDYVIRSFNDDKPYDQFLQEQIAGDELVDLHTVVRSVIDLPGDVVDAVIATGFLRNSADASRPDFVSIKHAPMYYFDTLNDAIAITWSATMGLTLHCAKCHDHKYDPIAQREYYQIQAIFKSGYRPDQWVPEENRFIEWASELEKQRAAGHNDKVQVVIDGLRRDAESLDRAFADRLFAERLGKLPEQIREDVKQAFSTEEKSRTEVQKYLVAKFQKELQPPREELRRLDADYKAKAEELAAAIRTEEAKKKTFVRIRALYDLPGEPKTHLMKRGDWRSPGEEVEPGVLSAIDTPRPFQWAPPQDAKTSGRRLAFARWITQPEHPLTARVMVNRIWMHHFGEGIVSTLDDFGLRGSRPTHPELLDWLATEFVARGWSIKAMHRLIMTSAVYRQAHRTEGARAKEIDPENRLHWRMRLRRVEAEIIRDSVLAASGSLDRKQFGPAVPLETRPDGEIVVPDGPAGLRRSIYLFVGRKVPVTMLHLFDQPMISVNCTRRGTSTLASQALDLLNSDFMVKQADVFAGRLLDESAPAHYGESAWDPTPAVTHAYKCCFGRPPNSDELADAVHFVRDQSSKHLSAIGGDEPDPKPPDLAAAQRRALADLCHMLLSANEFIYVD